MTDLDFNFDGNITYAIKTAWPGRSEPPEEVGRKFVRMLGLLEGLHPWFRDWHTRRRAPIDWENPDEYPPESVSVASLGPDLMSWVTDNTYRDDLCKQDPSGGYWLLAGSSHPSVSTGADVAHIAFCVGGSWVDHGSFEVGAMHTPPNPALTTYPIYKAVLLTVLQVWAPPWANAKCSIVGRRPTSPPGLPPFPYSGFQMPWISYLCAERAAKLGPTPDLITERTPDGGLLISATTDRFDPTNFEHMRASQRMAEIMIEHGGNPQF